MPISQQHNNGYVHMIVCFLSINFYVCVFLWCHLIGSCICYLRDIAAAGRVVGGRLYLRFCLWETSFYPLSAGLNDWTHVTEKTKKYKAVHCSLDYKVSSHEKKRLFVSLLGKIYIFYIQGLAKHNKSKARNRMQRVQQKNSKQSSLSSSYMVSIYKLWRLKIMGSFFCIILTKNHTLQE